jgi:pimeloyl-ACP methyl ester carboxylesterase
MLYDAAKQAIRLVPDAMAVRIAAFLANITKRPRVSSAEQAAMSKARLLRYGERNSQIAWEWGTGRIVVLIHGWSGRAEQMGPLAAYVADLGYRCIAPEITGHGQSRQRSTRWSYFARDIAALSRSLDDSVYAYIGHSAGGMTMIAANSQGRIRADKFVCVCAPSFPFPPVNGITKRLEPRASVIERYKIYLANEFGISWSRLESSAYYADAANLLLVYDERDRFVPHTEGDKIHALCPGSVLVKTRDYSHQKILSAPELFQAAAIFLGQA